MVRPAGSARRNTSWATKPRVIPWYSLQESGEHFLILNQFESIGKRREKQPSLALRPARSLLLNHATNPIEMDIFRKTETPSKSHLKYDPPVLDVKLLVKLREPTLVSHHIRHCDLLLAGLLPKLWPVLSHPGRDFCFGKKEVLKEEPNQMS